MNRVIQSAPIKQSGAMPQWISTVMACIFALQWTFTMLPHTLIIHNICFVIGAALGVYILAKNYQLLFQKNAAPIWLIFLLFLWMTFHLIFIGARHELQIAEYFSLWKRAVLGSIFAIGFGISIAKSNQSRNWCIVVLGICAPTIIYFIKYAATYLLPLLHIEAPEFLTLFYQSSDFYVAKIAYVFFCLPLLAVALGMLTEDLKSRRPNPRDDKFWRWFWSFAVVAVMTVFICENIKNGIMYSIVLISIFLFIVFKNGFQLISKSNLKIISVIFFTGVILMVYNIYTNPSWGTLQADYEIASQISPEIVWKSEEAFYPTNKYGITVSITNFDRFFYATTGIRLLGGNLLGYGLVQSSFGHLAQEQWSNAPLIQSHSGWLDLALGLGIPGIILLFFSGALAIRNVSRYSKPWSIFGAWGLVSILLLYTTTEVAQKNYVDTFVWFIVLVASLALPPQKQPAKVSK